MSTQRPACDIAIIGGGIVGLTAYLALRLQGFDVRLIERGKVPVLSPPDPDAAYDPRVYAITPSSAELLRTLEIWQQLDMKRVAPIRQMCVWDQQPADALKFDATAQGLGWIMEHRPISHALWATVDAAHLITECQVEHMQIDDDGVEMQLSDDSCLRAQLLVSAEGAGSSIRDFAGIETTGWDYKAKAIVCHLKTSLQHDGQALQRFLKTGPLALLPLADGRRSLVWSADNAEAEALLALDDAAFARRLEEATQSVAGTVLASSERISFPLRLLHASQYVSERCVLVGDSAHVVHPLAGQGLNLGLADVAELTRVLSEARQQKRSWSALRTLKRYERARAAENLEMLGLTDALNKAFSLDAKSWHRVLSFGMNTINRIEPLKQLLSARAAGRS